MYKRIAAAGGRTSVLDGIAGVRDRNRIRTTSTRYVCVLIPLYMCPYTIPQGVRDRNYFGPSP